MPFDRVVSLLHQDGSIGDWSSPEVMFSVHNSPCAPIDWPGLKVRVTEGLSYGTAKVPLNVVLLPAHPDPEAPDDPDAPAMTLIWEHCTEQLHRTHHARLARRIPRPARAAAPVDTRADLGARGRHGAPPGSDGLGRSSADGKHKEAPTVG